jgi:hypothetical protein
MLLWIDCCCAFGKGNHDGIKERGLLRLPAQAGKIERRSSN